MKNVRMWLPEYELDQKAKAQVEVLRNHPYVSDDIVILPDAHGGYGVPIGTVLKTQSAVIPNAVGVDIGCGMTWSPISGEVPLDGNKWREWAELVKQGTPTGNGAKGMLPERGNPLYFLKKSDLPDEFLDEHPNAIELAELQYGTLGGGNHFMEAAFDQYNNLYFIVHSGSRGIGAKIAEFYNRRAIIPSNDNAFKELAVLTPTATPAHFKNYILLVQKMELYAFRNRQQMINVMRRAFTNVFGGKYNPKKGITFQGEINNVHNNVFLQTNSTNYIHRKGAMALQPLVHGIIPGNMGDGSYIVKGKDNEHSYHSASHGAGRIYSRRNAKEILSMDDFRKRMSSTFTSLREAQLDESPMAYKDIHEVIRRQEDLLSVVTYLAPIITIKG